MNALVRCFLYEKANFEEVFVLSEGAQKSWADIERMTPEMPRGWFELSRISPEDRVEFVRTFWQSRLPFQPKTHEAITRFFACLDDVGVVLTKTGEEWTAQLIYSFLDNSSFFRGLPPASQTDLSELRSELNLPMPSDWTAFMKIHNGFGKLSEMELLKVEEISDARRRLMEMLMKSSRSMRSGPTVVDPSTLIPFYEVSGLSSFQCFYADWYPGNEMGNVYFSGMDYTLSDTSRMEIWEENGAYLTFLDWFASYLEGMEIAP